METPDGQHPSTNSVMPLLHHHHNQILLPFHRHTHHHHHHHLVMIPHCCAVHGFVPPPSGPPFVRQIAPLIPDTRTDLQPSLGDLEIQSSQMFEQQEDAYEELGEEAEEDPIFVLTDEWRDLFAKSEARRREAKKQARKHPKN